MESLVAWSQMLKLLNEISIENRFYNCYIIDHTNIRFLWWWWSWYQNNIKLPLNTRCRQHRISPLFVSWEKTLSYKNTGPVGFAAGQVDFQVTCPAGQVAVGTMFEAWQGLMDTLSLNRKQQDSIYQWDLSVVFVSMVSHSTIGQLVFLVYQS